MGIAVVVGRVDGAFGRVRKRPDTAAAPAGGVGQSANLVEIDLGREQVFAVGRREPLLGLDLPPNLVELQMGHSSLSQMNPCHNSAKCSIPLELRHSERSEESSLRRSSGKILRCAQNDGRLAGSDG